MATYTINVTLNTGGTPPVTVDQEVLTADFGSDTIFWIPASGQSGWNFASISFDPSTPFTGVTVDSQTIQATDENEAMTTVQTIFYNIYVQQGTTIFGSDPYVLNDPQT